MGKRRGHSSGSYNTTNYCSNNNSYACVAYNLFLCFFIIIFGLCILAVILHDSAKYTKRVLIATIQPTPPPMKN